MELLFARQLIPPQPDRSTAGEAAQPSSDLKKLHHPFHWTWASSRFLQPSPSHPPRQGQWWCWSQPCCWASQCSLLASTKALRPNALAGCLMATTLAESSDRKTWLSFTGRWGLCRAAHYSRSQLELPPSLTTETKVWDSRPNGVQKQSAGFHRSQSFEARPKTCTSEQIKTCAAGTLRSNPFLQQSRCSGGNTAPPYSIWAPPIQLLGRHHCPKTTECRPHLSAAAAARIRECRR